MQCRLDVFFVLLVILVAIVTLNATLHSLPQHYHHRRGHHSGDADDAILFSHSLHSHVQDRLEAKEQSEADTAAKHVIFNTSVSVLRAFAPANKKEAINPKEQREFLLVCPGCPRGGVGGGVHDDKICKELAATGHWEKTIAKRLEWMTKTLTGDMKRAMGSQRAFIELRGRRQKQQVQQQRQRQQSPEANGDEEKPTEKHHHRVNNKGTQNQNMQDLLAEFDEAAEVEQEQPIFKTWFVDVGANVGAFSFRMSQLVDTVVAIEASPKNAAAMSATQFLNAQAATWYKNVRAQLIQKQANPPPLTENTPANDQELEEEPSHRCSSIETAFADVANATVVPLDFSNIHVITAALSNSISSTAADYCLLVSTDDNRNDYQLECDEERLASIKQVGDKYRRSQLDKSSKPLVVRSMKKIKLSTLDRLLRDPSALPLTFPAVHDFAVLGRETLVIMKMDVESFEYRVAVGAEHFLTSAPPAVIVAEQWRTNEDLLAFLELMSSLGYLTVNAVTGRAIPSAKNYLQSSMAAMENFFFVRNDLASWLCGKLVDAAGNKVCGPGDLTAESVGLK